MLLRSVELRIPRPELRLERSFRKPSFAMLEWLFQNTPTRRERPSLDAKSDLISGKRLCLVFFPDCGKLLQSERTRRKVAEEKPPFQQVFCGQQRGRRPGETTVGAAHEDENEEKIDDGMNSPRVMRNNILPNGAKTTGTNLVLSTVVATDRPLVASAPTAHNGRNY